MNFRNVYVKVLNFTLLFNGYCMPRRVVWRRPLKTLSFVFLSLNDCFQTCGWTPRTLVHNQSFDYLLWDSTKTTTASDKMLSDYCERELKRFSTSLQGSRPKLTVGIEKNLSWSFKCSIVSAYWTRNNDFIGRSQSLSPTILGYFADFHRAICWITQTRRYMKSQRKFHYHFRTHRSDSDEIIDLFSLKSPYRIIVIFIPIRTFLKRFWRPAASCRPQD